MLNNSLSIPGTMGYSAYTLFIQPYQEGWNNFNMISRVFILIDNYLKYF